MISAAAGCCITGQSVLWGSSQQPVLGDDSFSLHWVHRDWSTAWRQNKFSPLFASKWWFMSNTKIIHELNNIDLIL